MLVFENRMKKFLGEIEKLRTVREDAIKVPDDPVEFCEKQLGFKPTEYQRKLLEDPAQFIAARWSRQSGKSFIVAALLLYLCLKHPQFSIIIVSPSLRQSKLVIRKVSNFLRYLPKHVAPKPFKIKIEFHNYSRIQAFPNNPETIRGELAHFVYIDEFNYAADDDQLYDAVVYSLATTNGRFLTTSTPGTRDSIFYRIFTDDDSYGDFSRHHITWRDAVEPNGPLKREILEKLRRQMSQDPWRWTREMEAEFAEDEDAWLSMSLIKGCIDQNIDRSLIPEEIILTGAVLRGHGPWPET